MLTTACIFASTPQDVPDKEIGAEIDRMLDELNLADKSITDSFFSAFPSLPSCLPLSCGRERLPELL